MLSVGRHPCVHFLFASHRQEASPHPRFFICSTAHLPGGIGGAKESCCCCRQCCFCRTCDKCSEQGGRCRPQSSQAFWFQDGCQAAHTRLGCRSRCFICQGEIQHATGQECRSDHSSEVCSRRGLEAGRRCEERNGTQRTTSGGGCSAKGGA